MLISSDFLGIDDLVEKCLVFVANQLEEVIRLPIEMSCLNATLLDRLSTKVDLTQLATLKDPKDKLSSNCLLYTSPSPRDRQKSRMPSSA